jgi:hypothetical protein
VFEDFHFYNLNRGILMMIAKLLLLLMSSLAVLSGCTDQKYAGPAITAVHHQKPKPAASTTTKPTESLSLNMITTSAVSKATTQEELIEKGVTLNLSDKENLAPTPSSFIETLTFGNVGLTAIRVPKVTSPTDYFFINQNNKGWSIQGVIGASIEGQIKPNSLSSEFSNLNHANLTVQNIGTVAEFFNETTTITIAKVKVSSSTSLPKGNGDTLNLNDQKAKFFEEGNLNGIYYPKGSDYVVIAGNVDENTIATLAKDGSIYSYIDSQQ